MPNIIPSHLNISLEINPISAETEIPSTTEHELLFLFGGELERYMTFFPVGPTWSTGSGLEPVYRYWEKAEAYAVLPKDWESQYPRAANYVTRDELDEVINETVLKSIQESVNSIFGKVLLIPYKLEDLKEHLDKRLSYIEWKVR